MAVAYGHVLVAESPIDMNIAKQLNILLSDASMDLSRTLIDPLTGGLGYGLEYTYSVMERIRLAALGGDVMLNSPMICLVGEEAWKAKEAKVSGAKEPLWGDERPRGIHWELATALALIEAGAEVAGAAPSRDAGPASSANGLLVRPDRARRHSMPLTGLANLQAASQHQLPEVRLPDMPGVRHEAGRRAGIAREMRGCFARRPARPWAPPRRRPSAE